MQVFVSADIYVRFYLLINSKFIRINAVWETAT